MALAVPKISLNVEAITLAQQRLFENRPFPLALAPALANGKGSKVDGGSSNGRSNGQLSEIQSPHINFVNISDVESWIRKEKGWILDQLTEHGAILFRGFPVNSADDFNTVVEAFGWEELPYIGGAAPRTNVVGRVFTSNESPPDQKIPFHHEMAQVPEFPAKLFFFCERAATEGGETPLLLSHVVTQQMQQKHPAFVEKLRKLGLTYTRILGKGDDASSAIGRGWQSTFLTTDSQAAEDRATKLGMKLDWLPGGSVKTVSGPLPALRLDPQTNRETWFNSMVAAFTGWQDARNTAEKTVTFGDGSLLDRDAVYDCLAIMEEICVAIPWIEGDVVLIDNRTVQHARRPFQPPRRVLASLTK